MAPPSDSVLSPDAREAWGARLGWLFGGATGLCLGFLVTWALEVYVLQGRVGDPKSTAASASSLCVGGGFLVGALAGHGFGKTGGKRRRKFLAAAVGVMLALGLWAALVVAR
jgi:uncharacterized membrane protein